jgi:DNA-binding XRE family transcriptional regulator
MGSTTKEVPAWSRALYRARLDKEQSQPQAARELGVSKDTIGRWEAGRRINPSRWVRVAKYLGMEFEAFEEMMSQREEVSDG